MFKMTSVHDVLTKFRNQNANGAYSGAYETWGFIQEGKEHLIYPFYQKICQYGDWEKASGIKQLLQILGREELLKAPLPPLYFDSTSEIGEGCLCGSLGTWIRR